MKYLKPACILLVAATLSACAQTSHWRGHRNMPDHPHHQQAMQFTHTVTSKYSFDDTVSRLENTIKAKGMTIFTVIDHHAAARANGLNMQPAKVIIFGNPKAGTPLMVKDPEFAIRLPLRVLVTENNGTVQVVFHNTRALIQGTRIQFNDVENTLANAEKLIVQTVTQ
ncbi:DUF302 domain-containing protein [Neisseria zalophi]|uniref:DUF302 domain-containing protein n=1 Tax=Neisseria zalophi TaxID=640030 RepID=A0A5J6PXH8_9NEIS|nr:DUF302 domain-containing protein [Neisseria zalophi]QEY25823.1 DUF302 domain-containing protein [Neisseria zalophi]